MTEVPHEEQHRQLADGWSRAAIFGMADGLVTNVSLMLGIAGAASATHTAVRLAGLAGLVAGGLSMASGEYLSMRAQKELFEREIEVERKSLLESPEEERAELVGLFVSRGIDADLAGKIAAELMRDPELALLTHTREELGIDPSAIGNPWKAAGSSLVAFCLGALIPLLPWLVSSSGKPVAASIVLGAVGSASLGCGIGVLTGRNAALSALRFTAISGFAAATTYLVGYLIG